MAYRAVIGGDAGVFRPGARLFFRGRHGTCSHLPDGLARRRKIAAQVPARPAEDMRVAMAKASNRWRS